MCFSSLLPESAPLLQPNREVVAPGDVDEADTASDMSLEVYDLSEEEEEDGARTFHSVAAMLSLSSDEQAYLSGLRLPLPH
jgi:hypothetical protein